MALLHDLGNVVKFTLEKPNRFVISDGEVDRLAKLQQQIIVKYGNDDHEVASKMMNEIGVDSLIKKTINAKSFGNSVALSKSSDWYGKILAYSDMRVMPKGICTLDERVEDIRKRMPKYVARPDFEDLCNACKEIEKQIQANLTVVLSEIKDENIGVDFGLLKIEI